MKRLPPNGGFYYRNDLWHGVEKQINEMPALPSNETTEKINRLISLKDFLVVEMGKREFDNGNVDQFVNRLNGDINHVSKNSILTPNSKRNVGTGEIRRVRLSIKDKQKAYGR